MNEPLLSKQLRALLEGERDETACLANASALINEAFREINWAGFYLAKNGELLLGPFQGKPACMHIPFTKGVCGAAFSGNRTLRVANVHEFPGHIACDSASNSEIVIPIRNAAGEPVGVLDMDSPVFDRFSAEDEALLTACVRELEAILFRG